MRVLIGCEESGVSRRAFRERGHEAYSCDLQPARDGSEFHYQCDIGSLIGAHFGWDLVILHPDCTKMAVSGNRHYGRGTPGEHLREQQVNWTLSLWRHFVCSDPNIRVALENPVSVIFTAIKKHHPDTEIQYVQPWQFGHGETKKTGFALHNLPPLKPTNIVEGREQRIWKMAPGPNRKRDRSETYQGIAEAMADQWGSL